jgi:hypothetical protein
MSGWWFVLGTVIWVMVGYGVCDKMKGSERFIDWLNRDPTGVVSYLLMIGWPIFAYLIYKGNR